MIPVFDIPNFFVNAANNKTLFAIHHQLKSQSKGTVVYNTVNIDRSTDISAKIDIRNIDIDAEFTWIINQGGGEIIPIPGPVRKGLDSILNWKAPAMFTAQFKAAADFEGLADVVHSKAAAIDGSRARKAANDTLITSLGSQQDALKKEMEDLEKMAEMIKKTDGHGMQLQIANAMSASQINQIMKLRSMMVVSEASRAVEAQVSADKDARAIVVGNHLREGLDSAVNQSLVPLSTY
jgi:hypothetical protein